MTLNPENPQQGREHVEPFVYRETFANIYPPTNNGTIKASFRGGSRFGSFEQLIEFPKMNMDCLLNKPYVNGVILRGQNLSLKCC